ncbi:MAG: DUF1016 N-terminal domain-containing protein [Atopobiaceae bacterium]
MADEQGKGPDKPAALGAQLPSGFYEDIAQTLEQARSRGFTQTNLRYMCQFYLAFSNRHALRDELAWIHYRSLSRVTDPKARTWYEHEATERGLFQESELEGARDE